MNTIAYYGLIQAYSGLIQAYSGLIETYSRLMQAYSGLIQVYCELIQACSGFIQVYSGLIQAYSRLIQAYLSLSGSGPRPLAQSFSHETKRSYLRKIEQKGHIYKYGHNSGQNLVPRHDSDGIRREI